VYAFLHASSHSWHDSLTVGSLVLATVLAAGFAAVERHAAQPLVPSRLFHSRNRTGAYIIMLFTAVAMFDILYFLTQFLQKGLGYSPIAAGAAFLPMTVTIFTVVRAVPRLIRRFAIKPVLLTGTASIASAMVWLTQITATGGYFAGVLGPLILFGFGMALTMPSLTVSILSGVHSQNSGAASGVLQTIQWIGGGSLGLAVLVTVYAGAAGRAAPQTPARTVLAHAASDVFTAGAVAAICAVLMAATVMTTVKEPPPPTRPDSPSRDA
jgi:hypothetical protein